jgi:hypothetical protein
MAAILVGCSKKEETSAPPTAQPAVPVVPSTPNAPAPAQAAANAQMAAASAASNVVAVADKLTTNATNAAVVPASAGAPPAPIAKPLSLADLSTDQLTQGLKEALGKGLQHAVASLGQPGGFFTNLNVKIPLPDKLQSVEKTLRAIGQGQLADQCIATMNQAAEQAVPAAADVFVNSLKNMSVEDAKGILNGPTDAATQYFRRTTETELTQKFLPIIQQSMTKCGATAAYEQVMDKARVASPFFKDPSLDLNAYVTGKALDGLFKMVADEEKRIRENPVARSTDLLKSVFGALQK